MKKVLFLWVILLTTSISCSPDKSQSQTIQGQTPTTETQNLGEYENKILDRAETFYNNRMTQLLWTMGIIMAAGAAIVGIVIPILLEERRKIRFAKELETQSHKFNERLSQSEDAFKKYAEEEMRKLDKSMAQNFSMLYSGMGGILSSRGAYELALQTTVLAMMNFIDSDCSGACLSSSDIIRLLSNENVSKKIGLDALNGTDRLIEDNKKAIDKITDAKKREDMARQVRELQIYIHQLIYKKQHTPPQSSPQQS